MIEVLERATMDEPGRTARFVARQGSKLIDPKIKSSDEHWINRCLPLFESGDHLYHVAGATRHNPDLIKLLAGYFCGNFQRQARWNELASLFEGPFA